ncbi:MAG: DNA polymerase III subunit gamma/tau, partial [Arenicellales bacterium]
MSYQVLARKWRPQNFQELVGQEHVQRALVNALNDDRLHHAYLFTGTRGVGKTTIARIFSKSLNCETGITSTPCGVCSTCMEIAEGRYVDLIEVDAASRTGVDDTRDLLENVQYAPTRGRYKVYLIDEVHMFSKSSFNALLKTLEEPPPHVKFLLATTDPQKLPVTILSRCLQFNLKRLPVSLIISHLQHILSEEKVEYNVIALQLIAEAADGSMRDALSLLDQALEFCGGSVQEQEVRDMLGSVSRDKVIRLLKSVLQRDAQQTLSVVAELAEMSPDFENVLAELLSLLHHMSLAKTVPEILDEFVSAREALLELSEQVSAEDLHLFYQIALIGRRDLPLSPDAKNGFEMIMLRMLAFRPAVVDADSVPQTQTQPEAQTYVQETAQPQALAQRNPQVVKSKVQTEPVVQPVKDAVKDTIREQDAAQYAELPAEPAAAQTASGNVLSNDWRDIVNAL